MIEINGSGLVNAPINQIPILAVNVLDRLGYHVTRHSKQLDQVLATERLDEKIGMDWWHHEYKVVIRWEPVEEGLVEVAINLKEVKGGASRFECQKRLDQIIFELHEDAKRMQAKNKQKEKSTAYGAAKWGTDDDLAKKGYFLDTPDPKRLIIGRTADRKYIQVPEFWTHAHALICGRTGVGKSRGFFIPQLIERIATSMVVTEATPGIETGELYKLTSGWRKMAGNEVYSFNVGDMSSNRINPIDSVRFAPEDEKASRAEKIADLVIMNGESGEGKYEQTWNRSEKLLLMPMIMHAAAGDPELGHFGALRWHLLRGPAYLANLMKSSPSDVAQMEFEGWLSLSGESNFKYGVFSGLLTKLNPWLTDQIVTLTEKTDIDLAALKKQLFTFYLAVPSRAKESKLIGSLILNFLLDHILEIREEMQYPVTMLLDEFTNFGKIMGIGDTLSIIRKNKIGLTLGFQNYFQLEQVYSRNEAHVIMDQPATQVYFKQKNFREAKELSEALGRTTVEEATVTDAGRVHETVQGRPLITPDELIGLDNEVVIFTADTRPLKLALTEPTSYDQAMAYDPPSRSKHEVTEFVRKRGRMDGAQDSEYEPFDLEKGRRARQGPPPDIRFGSPDKKKSKPANQGQAKPTAPAGEQKDKPPQPPAAEVDPVVPPPAEQRPQAPTRGNNSAPHYGD